MLKNKRALAYLALLLTSIIWGITTPAIKYILNFISPFQFIFLRFLIASIIVIIPLISTLIKVKPNRKTIIKYLLIGLLGAPLTLLLFSLGLQKTTAVNTSIISNVSPILIILGGVYFFHEKVSRKEKLGIVFVLTGTLLAIFGPMIGKTSAGRSNLWGDFIVVLAYFCWVIYSLLLKKENKLNLFILSASSFASGMITSFAALFLFDKNPLSFMETVGNTYLISAIISVAVFATVIAYFAYAFGISKIEASEAVIFTYLQPIFGVIVSIYFLKEEVAPIFWIGALLIIVGVYICQFLRKKEASR